MAAKARKPAVSTKSHSTSTVPSQSTKHAVTPTAVTPVPSTVISNQQHQHHPQQQHHPHFRQQQQAQPGRHFHNQHQHQQDHLISVPSSGIVPDDLDQQQRSTQNYQGTAPLRQLQQSPNLSNPPNQQAYGVQNVFSPNTGLQSPYIHHPPHFSSQPPSQAQGSNESNYYQSNPSPRSTTSTAFFPSEKTDSMAAAATMHRPPYPPMYHTPQSNSPASVTSPQTHDHTRPMFAPQQSQMSQPMYAYSSYQQLGPMHQSPYGPHGQSQMNPQPMLPNQYSTSPISHGQVTSHAQTLSSSPQLKQEQSQQYAQTPQGRSSLLAQQQPTPGQTPGSGNLPGGQGATPGSTSNAAPGPIPATTPLVVRQDNNGVQWIAFEYSRDRVKMEYTIRCDVESVDTNSLSPEFKSENCVYPRACVPKDQYKGNRLNYESDCNQVGWALAELNPCLRGKRGLIQRAVDSWRNSNQDVRLRSRRVRRQAKMTNKTRTSNIGPVQTSGSTGPVPTELPGSGSMVAPINRPPGSLPTSSQILHHHGHDISPTGQDPSGGYSANQGLHRSSSASQHMPSPNDLRHTQTFPGYQPYATVPTTLGPSMTPQMGGGMHHFGRSGGNTTMVSKLQQDKDDDDSALFGDVPEGKRRKFILVDDTQKNARVRVKVTLDQIEMSEIPDSYRKNNSVYPRAFYPVQMQPAAESSASGRFNDRDTEDMDDGPPIISKTTVPCTMTGGDGEVEVPQLTRSKRGRELKINELGYRMAWGQGRVFSNRPIFLSRALDAYRVKQRTALLAAGRPISSIPAHLETRPGKRKWLERTRSNSHPPTPPPVTDE